VFDGGSTMCNCPVRGGSVYLQDKWLASVLYAKSWHLVLMRTVWRPVRLPQVWPITLHFILEADC